MRGARRLAGLGWLPMRRARAVSTRPPDFAFFGPVAAWLRATGVLAGLADLRALGYPTAFTLARAAIPGVNLAFQRLDFQLRGTMPQSCRIGEGIEDMNIWSRAV